MSQNTAAPSTAVTAKAATSRKVPAKKSQAVKKAVPVKAASAAPATKSKAVVKTSQAAVGSTKPAAKSPEKTSAVAPAKPLKDKKVKVVRDSFTLPKIELLQIAEMKKRAMTLGVEVKKSELIRAGLHNLSGMADASFKKALASIPTIKTGRPAKD